MCCCNCAFFVVGLFSHMFRWGLEESSFDLLFWMLNAYPSLSFLGSVNASFKALSSSGLQASSCIKHHKALKQAPKRRDWWPSAGCGYPISLKPNGATRFPAATKLERQILSKEEPFPPYSA